MKVWSHVSCLMGYACSHPVPMGQGIVMGLQSLPSVLHTLKIICWSFSLSANIMNPQSFLKCNNPQLWRHNRIISSSIFNIFDNEGNTWPWRLLKESGLSSNMILYQCMSLISIKVKKSANPCLPIFLIEVITAMMTIDSAYSYRYLEPLSWAVRVVDEYHNYFVDVIVMLLPSI